MASSIPISGLNELATVTADDFLAFVDSGSSTTYRVSVETFNNFFADSGSVLSSSFASASITASHTIQTDSASYLYPRLYEMTSSWTQNVVWTTVVGTASLAYNARTASRLEGIGSSYEQVMTINNSLGTANDAYIELPKRNATTSSVALSSIKNNSVFFNKDYSLAGSTGYAKLFYYDLNGTPRGKLVFELGDIYTQVDNIGPNIDSASLFGRGFLFQTNEAGNASMGTNTGSLLFISSSGRVYGRIFEAQAFSSSVATSGGVGFYGTASYAVMTDYALGTGTAVPTGMVVAYADTVPPTGWLNCDGTQYDPGTYPALYAKIGTNYGRALNISVYVKPETVSTYANANDGIVKLTWTSGGSGIFRITWASSNYYINGTTAAYVQFTGLNSGNYSYTWRDYGVSPVLDYARTVAVPYGGAVSTTPYTLNSATYRVPQMSSYYFLTYATISPLIWMIKT